MKTSKLLITSLLAAATLMSSVPSWADVTYNDGQTTTLSSKPTENIVVSASESGGVTEVRYSHNTDDVDDNKISANITINEGAVFSDFSDYKYHLELGGTLSGSGTLRSYVANDNATGSNGQGDGFRKVKISGDASTFKGTWILESAASKYTGNGGGNRKIFGELATGSFGGVVKFEPLTGTDAPSMTVPEAQRYSYLNIAVASASIAGLEGEYGVIVGGATLDGNRSTVNNTGSAALTIALTGNATHTFSGTIDSSISTLTISGAGTQAISGAINAGSVIVESGAGLDLSGATVASSSAIQNSGTVTVSSSTVFVLADVLKDSEKASTWNLITGGGNLDGWASNTLSINNFRKADGSLFSGRSSANVGTAGAVTITEVVYDLVWSGTSGKSTWNETAEDVWKKDSLSGESVVFVSGDNVAFDSNASEKTVTLENGATLRVGTLKVNSGDYMLNVGAGNSATISGSTLSVAKGASLQLSEQLSGANVSSLNLVFDDISLEGTLKVYTNAIDSWTKLTFAGDGAGTLYLYDIGGNAETTGLTISTMRMSAAGSIEAKWGGRVAISSLTGAGDLTINKPTDESSIYVISNMNGYSGKLITQGSGGGSLTVEISGSNSTFTGNIEVGSETTVKMTGSGNVLGAESADRYAAVVKTGGTLNLNGNGVFNKIELAGGALVNNGGAIEKGKQQLSGLKLSANSIVGGTGNFGLVASQWAGNVLDLAGFTLTKTGSNEFLLASTTVKAGTIDVRQGTLTVMNGNSNQKMFSMESGALIKLNGGTLKATVPTGSLTSVNLGDVAVVLTDTNKDTARITADSSCTFNAGNATLYLDIGALTETVLTGDEVALTIAGSNVISAENFFDTVLVGTYDSGDNWINDTEWAYKAGSWDASTGTLYLISVPEPSAFGLLAGAGALALVAARRRRTKKA